MLKYLNPKRFYYAVGRGQFLQFVLFVVFLLFFYGPLMHMVVLAFGDQYEVPYALPTKFGFKWWRFVFSQNELMESVATSLVIAVLTTVISLILCIPAAYALSRFQFKGRKMFMFSFLLTNAFPKLGIYTSIGLLFYKFDLMGTMPGVIIIHIINTMIFMVWLPAGAFRTIHTSQEEAARDVGASPFMTFLRVTMPMAMPGIAVACIYTFLGSLEENQGTLLVGMPTIKTMAVEMYGIILDYPVQAGAVFAIFLIVPSIILIYCLRRFISPEAMAGGFNMK
ncbi:ABC transporter permease [Bifidobacterium samirii]|uniref:ABC transporter permease protein n=1 Tax=Bifidobacterium samirii TaxID=2306974 RepID=A0A430FWA6_9BIFI|nr:ABC transporter permease subunit [Bifidobacterium samirii]RSX58390.1 aBC transporter permease protein [Bifidobacterium samirii]